MVEGLNGAIGTVMHALHNRFQVLIMIVRKLTLQHPLIWQIRPACPREFQKLREEQATAGVSTSIKTNGQERIQNTTWSLQRFE